MAGSGASLSLVAVVAVMFFMVPAQAQTTWHVDNDASLGGDGTGWTTAHKYLQDALAVATSGDRIRVAGGTYKPDQDDQGNVIAGDRSAAFQLISGVAIYGGYRGCPGGDCDAGDPDERNLELYETTLSGDLSGNDADVASPDDLLREPTRAENSYHVVTCTAVDETAVLDGLTISGGNANRNWQSHPDSRGGGVFSEGGSPTLRDCVFFANSARQGGGVYSSHGDPALTNCTFLGNSAGSGFGGGMSNQYDSNATVMNCTFSGNSANHGGGMFNYYVSAPTLTNCSFTGNSANGSGGGMSNLDHGSQILTNCSFTGNSAEEYGGGMYGDRESNATLTHCTFSENSAEHGGGVYNSHESTVTLILCTFSDNWAVEHGGALESLQGSSAVLTSCVFSGNAARRGGGILNWVAASLTVNNCMFSSNAARIGGGIENSAGGTLTVSSSTLTGNSAWAPMGGGMYNGDESSLTATDCIVWGDTGGAIVNHGGGTATVTFSTVQGGWTNDDCPIGYPDCNLDSDPLFVPGPSGCLYLSQMAAGQVVDSPCVDAGSDTAENLALDTLTTRSDEGNDTGIADMGYHYAVSGQPLIMGDYNRDLDVNLADFAAMQDCFTGEGPADVSPCCRIFDFEHNDDIHLDDVAAFVEAFYP